jgi:hypothetical protein
MRSRWMRSAMTTSASFKPSSSDDRMRAPGYSPGAGASAGGSVRGARHQSAELVQQLCAGLIRQGAGRIIEETREGLLAGA